MSDRDPNKKNCTHLFAEQGTILISYFITLVRRACNSQVLKFGSHRFINKLLEDAVQSGFYIAYFFT